jgi:hypothetical protein
MGLAIQSAVDDLSGCSHNPFHDPLIDDYFLSNLGLEVDRRMVRQCSLPLNETASHGNGTRVSVLQEGGA